MKHWAELAQFLYYLGAGSVLLGTGVRFLYRFIVKLVKDCISELIEEKLKEYNPSPETPPTELDGRQD